METPSWVRDALFYQIFPDRFYNGDPRNDPPECEPWGRRPTRDNYFGGDLRGLIRKLDYIQELGCNAIYLNPIFEAGTNHKYDTYDYLSIDPAFGTAADFDELVSEIHLRGMHIILDGVFNHCGTGFAPFRDAVEQGLKSPFWEWFDFYGYPVFTDPAPNYATCGGAAYLPRLNTRHREVKALIHRVALYWLERGIDGWRLDVPYEIAPEFWREFRMVIKNRFPEAYLVAEEWRNADHFLQGDTFDGAMHYELRSLALDFFVTDAVTGEAFARALDALQRRVPESSAYGMLTLLGSHDTPRIRTLCGGDNHTVAPAFAFLMTMPGVPMIYYGDEIGMEGGDDPDCRRPMVWEKAEWDTETQGVLRSLIALRRRTPALRHGSLTVLFGNDRCIAYERRWNDQTVVVVLNNSRVKRSIEIPTAYPDGSTLRGLTAECSYVVADGKVIMDHLAPKSYAVYEVTAP